MMKKEIYRCQPAVILAGGQSRRMKCSDKGEVFVGPDRLIEIVHSNVSEKIGSIYISGPHDYGLEAKVISDFEYGPKGPLAGLYACCGYFARNAFGFFTVPVDGPNFPPGLFERLFSLTHSSVAVDDRGMHPVYAWWRIEDLQKFWSEHSSEENFSLKFLIDKCGSAPVTWSGFQVFNNINTPEELQSYSDNSII